VDPYSFFPNPDPEFAVGDQYGSGSGTHLYDQKLIRIHNTAYFSCHIGSGNNYYRSDRPDTDTDIQENIPPELSP
jgi:hypothetical protein